METEFTVAETLNMIEKLKEEGFKYVWINHPITHNRAFKVDLVNDSKMGILDGHLAFGREMVTIDWLNMLNKWGGARIKFWAFDWGKNNEKQYEFCKEMLK